MPAFDDLAKSALTAHDISAAATQATVAQPLGRTGLVEGLSCTVVIGASDASAVAFPNGIKFHFEYTTNNGSTWRRGGQGFVASGAKRICSFPVGFLDIVPEQNADTDIDWRVVADIVAVIADADDYSFTAYLTGRQGFGAVID